MQIIAMTGTINTEDTIELTCHAMEIGLDAASAVAPYYYHHNMDDVTGFYRDIMDAVGRDFPVYIYTNPKFSGYAVDMDTMKRLKELGLAGVKAASFDIMEYANYVRELRDDNFDVVLGTEALWLPAAVYGGQAFIPGLANVFPEICVQMFEESQRGDYEACRKTQFKINELRQVMYLARSSQLAIYAMLELRGVVVCFPQKPFTSASAAEMKQMETRLKELGML